MILLCLYSLPLDQTVLLRVGGLEKALGGGVLAGLTKAERSRKSWDGVVGCEEGDVDMVYQSAVPRGISNSARSSSASVSPPKNEGKQGEKKQKKMGEKVKRRGKKAKLSVFECFTWIVLHGKSGKHLSGGRGGPTIMQVKHLSTDKKQLECIPTAMP